MSFHGRDWFARVAAALCRGESLALTYARTFCEVPPGDAFWYENALGLVELAVNQRRADLVLGLDPGDRVLPPE